MEAKEKKEKKKEINWRWALLDSMGNQIYIQPLNLTGKAFCERLGVSYNGQIMQALRELGLVSFFKVGKKYLYAYEDIEAVNQKLRKGEISIRVNNGYYITLNE